jgi:hypothetical protein
MNREKDQTEAEEAELLVEHCHREPSFFADNQPCQAGVEKPQTISKKTAADVAFRDNQKMIRISS